MEQISEKLNRIKTAKENIKKSIENKGVVVGDVSIENYAEKIDEITTGSSATTNDASYLFYGGARLDVAEQLMGMLGKVTSTKYMYSTCRTPKTIDISKLDTSENKDMDYMFQNDNALKNIIGIENINLDNITSLREVFSGCGFEILDLSNWNVSNIKNMQSMFSSDSSLKTLNINGWDTSKVEYMNYTWQSCRSLTDLSKLNTSSIQYIQDTLTGCTGLVNFGGFENLGMAYLTSRSANYSSYKLNLSGCTSLTHDSLMNVINNLYDIATKGCKAQSLTLGSTNLAKLTEEEIAIATNKGWTVS